MDYDNKYGALEIQRALLTLLKEFDEFCQKEKIRYSLSSGSLLGAVRHKGFIPWDDDLDCIMEREEFNKFCMVVNNHNILRIEHLTESSLWVERVRFRKIEYEGNYQPTLDLFVIDNCPDNVLIANFKILIIKVLQGMIKYHLNLKKGNWFMKLCTFVTFLLGRLFSHKKKYDWYTKVAQWGNGKPTEFMKIYHDQWHALNYRYPREIIQNIKRFSFEDTTVCGFVEYDKYLRIIYGDNYMTPPEEENRVPLHI